MRFFLTDLGEQKVILGYPWFAAMQPRVDWARAWIDYEQLPVVLRTPNAHKAIFTPIKDRLSRVKASFKNLAKKLRRIQNEDRMFVTRVYVEPQITSASHRQTQASKLAEKKQSSKKATPLPEHYQRHAHVFSEQEAQRFPGPRLWDHAIELKKDTPATLPGKIYALTQDEQKALQEFIKEHVQKGYIQPSKSPYAAPFFFIKKKGRTTTTSSGLQTTKRMDHTQLIPPSPHQRTHLSRSRSITILQIRHTLGIQQCAHQRRR